MKNVTYVSAGAGSGKTYFLTEKLSSILGEGEVKGENVMMTTFTELGIPADTDFRAITDSTNITAGCCKKLTRDEICEILKECL